MLLQQRFHATNAMGHILFLALSAVSTGSSIKEFAVIKMEKGNDLFHFLHSPVCTSNMYLHAFLT